MAEWILKITTCKLSVRHTGRLKEKRCKKICYANINQRKTEMTILISDKVDFRAKKIT